MKEREREREKPVPTHTHTYNTYSSIGLNAVSRVLESREFLNDCTKPGQFGEVDMFWRVLDECWHANLNGYQLVQVGTDIGNTRRGSAGGGGGGESTTTRNSVQISALCQSATSEKLLMDHQYIISLNCSQASHSTSVLKQIVWLP